MKTAISLPDEVYQAADRMAAKLGMSRSRFFATAAQRYVDEMDQRSLTAQINEAVAAADSDDAATAAVAAGRERLAADDDW